MKIAIDVHSLGSQAAGNETYVRHLLQGSERDRSANQYTLFGAHPSQLEEIDHDPRFGFVPIPKIQSPGFASRCCGC